MFERNHNQYIDDTLNEKIAQLLEHISMLYGVKIHIEDTDWQCVYDLKEEVFKQLESLGIKVII